MRINLICFTANISLYNAKIFAIINIGMDIGSGLVLSKKCLTYELCKHTYMCVNEILKLEINGKLKK